MFLIWPILIYAGISSKRLTIQPFIVFLVIATVFNAIGTMASINGAAALGEDQSWRWHPLVFTGDVIISTALYSAVYCIGYLIGRWRRSKSPPE